MSLKIVIVGGVAGGASAAAKARRVHEQAEIIMFEKGPYVSFANCGLPYYIGDEITLRKSLFLQTPESLWDRFRIKVHVRHEVLRIHRAVHQVEVRNLETDEVFRQPYDKLILAPGAGAIVPPLSGIEARNIFTVKTVPDSDAVKDFITQHHPKRAVVVGAGFIGLESAEALKRRGLDVTLVEMLPQVLPPLDSDMAALVARHLEENGVHLVLGDGIKAFIGDSLTQEVELRSGRRLPADLVILSIGVRPELKLALDAALKIGEAGGIVVNERQQTSDPDIYAAGDAVEVTHLVTGRKARIPLAGPANKQGRVAGANAAGLGLIFPGAVGTAIVESMGITAAKTGLSEREASQANLAAIATVTHSLDHAGYYPGAELLHIKLIAEVHTGRLLGAQIVGERGVDKRIDVLATALEARMKVTDLENLDLAYAPQFSSAKDPVIMAGFVASNVARDIMPSISCQALRERSRANPDLQLVDVRSSDEFDSGHLEGARLLPLDELRDRLGELDPRKETVVYCRVGFRGYLAALILQQNGFGDIRNLTGGLLICPEGAPRQPTRMSNGDSGNVKTEALKAAIGRPGSVALDVREQDEYAYEHIVGTQNAPLSQLAQTVVSVAKDQDVYVLCQSGARAQQGAGVLRSLGFSRVHVVDGGLNAWKAAALPVERRRGPIPIMRQVQIVAGSLALIGGAVPGLRWVAVIVGAGLIFAGCSGMCGMAKVLSYLPWNKPSGSQQASAPGCAPCASLPPR
jgi:NADPH-dependent 2,4-dienoyl-CoA reductase/sulfur reductase-like enzyme/rhodanese-related sulfurtransferase